MTTKVFNNGIKTLNLFSSLMEEGITRSNPDQSMSSAAHVTKPDLNVQVKTTEKPNLSDNKYFRYNDHNTK